MAANRSNGILAGAIVLCLLRATSPAGAAEAVFSDGGADAESYGAGDGYPVGGPATANQQRFMVGAYSHFDQLHTAHLVSRAPEPAPLGRAGPEITLTYPHRGENHTLTEYLARNPTTGLLIARGDAILFEHYQYGRTDRDRLTSQSMAKTVTGMLIGIALQEGAIRSVDDPAATYVTELAGTELGRTPLRALLHMASGIQFNEAYVGPSDSAALARALLGRNGRDPIAAVSAFNIRVAAPDTLWHYAGLNTEVLGLVLTHATGMSMAQYLQTRIWQPMGAEADATWTVDSSGQEMAYCCFNATLRDYARLGLLLAHDGARDGRAIIPRQYVLDATTMPEAGSFRGVGPVGPFWGYGNQVWLMRGQRGAFAFMGIHGQRLFVDPVSKLVMVHTAVRVKPNGNPEDSELTSLWLELLRQYGATPG